MSCASLHRMVVLAASLTLLLPQLAFSLDVAISVAAREGASAVAVPVASGIPFAEGALRDPGLVRLLLADTEVPAQFRRVASWPDGSVRWLRVEFVSDLIAFPGSTPFVVRTGTAPAAVTGITIDDQPGSLTVATGTAAFTFTKNELRLGGATFDVQSGGQTYQAVPGSWVIEDPGPVKATVRVEGTWRGASGVLGNELIRFRARLIFHRNSSTVRAEVTFRNNGPFCWEAEGCVRHGEIALAGARFGAALLPEGGNYVMGPGAEKTWKVEFPSGAAARLVFTAFKADGSLAAGASSPAPLALASPAYYASTGAWGQVSLPVRGLSTDRQGDLDRFEKLQRAKVLRSEVENPTNLTGITLTEHLAQDLGSWNDYGDLRWAGNGCGTLSGNHYDWTYGMYLQLMRTGILPFADAARVFAAHEIDFDIYHTGADSTAFNYQKNWEDRPSHDSPDNCFGGGRPTHTWSQGYALHWLLTGDARGRDGFEEVQEGVRQYLYESFSGEGHVSTSEIRAHGWLTENLVARYRMEPSAILTSSSYPPKTIPQAIKDVLEDVFIREAAAGGHGFVYESDDWSPGQPAPAGRAPLQHIYFLEPAIKAYLEVFKGRDSEYAARLLGLIQRISGYLMAITYGGDTNSAGLYRPLQIPYHYETTQPIEAQGEGQIVYGLQVANAAGFLYLETGDPKYLDYARATFRDYIRYFALVPGDSWADPALRSPTAYNTSLFDGTESKIHGWSNRYGQYYLAAEAAAKPVLFVPAVLASPGRAGSYYTSEMTLTNLGTREAEIRFLYTPFAGEGAGTSSSVEKLGPGRQLVVEDAITYLRGMGVPLPADGARAGTLHVTFDGLSDASEAAVTVRTTTPVPPLAPKGRAGLAYAGVAPAGLLTGASYLCGLRHTDADRSAIAVQNAGSAADGDITLRVSLVTASGEPAGGFDVQLPPGGFHQPPSLPEVKQAQAGFYARIERVAGTAPYYAYGVVNDNQNSDGSFLLPVPEGAGGGAARLILPAIVETDVYSTEVFLANTTGARRSVELTYAAPAIPGGSSRLTIELAAGEQRVLPRFVQVLRDSGSPDPGPLGPTYTGPVVITVPGGTVQGIVAGARTMNPDQDGVGQYGVAYGAVPSADAATDAAVLFGLRQDAETRTNLALVNTADGDGSAIQLRVELFDGDTGRPAGETTRDLAPLQFLQLGRVLADLAPGTANGYARVTRVSGGSPFITYSVVNDGSEPRQRSGDGAFVAMRKAVSPALTP